MTNFAFLRLGRKLLGGEFYRPPLTIASDAIVS